MKKYMAFVQGANSGIVTKENAEKWAAKILADRPQTQIVHICEVIATCERTTPTVETKQFFCQLDEPSEKAA